MDKIVLAVALVTGLIYGYRRFRGLGGRVKQSFHDGKEQGK